MDKEPRSGRLKIPKGTRVVPRDGPDVVIVDGDFSDSDARKMSPRRDNKSTERRAKEAKKKSDAERHNAEQKLSQLSDLKGEISDLESKSIELQKNNELAKEATEKLIEHYGK
jgi:hypothetical protein